MVPVYCSCISEGKEDCVMPTESADFLAHDGFENPFQRFRKLIIEVILRVNWDVMLQNIEWVFRFLVGSRS
jgi:hypothetical protein